MTQTHTQTPNPRSRAAHALVLLEEPGQGNFLGSQAVLREVLDQAPVLTGPDRGLCTELVYGVLRRQRALDRWIAGSCREGLFQLHPRTLAILRVGALQLADLRVPSHAAVHATMEVAKRLVHPRQASFIHAVLRGLDRRLQKGDRPDDADLPPWMARRVQIWAERTGVDALVLQKSLSQPAPLFVHALDGDTQKLKLALESENVPTTELHELAIPGVLRCEDGRFLQTQIFADRQALVQDAASAAVIEWLVHVLGDAKGKQVGDIAAGQGVKSARLVTTGAQVTAIDVNPHKLTDAAVLCRQIGHPLAQTIAGDATQDLGLAAESFDAILLDAPCSALGTLRRRPELRHRRMAADLLRMAHLQARLLEQAAKWLKPGGVLAYAVCSFAEEEGTLQIEEFLRNHPDFSRHDAPPAWLQPWLDPQGDLLSRPGIDGADGFFAAMLKKNQPA